MLFSQVAATEQNPKWKEMIARQTPLYLRPGDVRSEFGRDYTRIVHSTAYRRLKHKTQVFFAPTNDHVCTRIEHVGYVESVSFTIANTLGLNTELTKAISVGHDLGHAPFGHCGEEVLNSITQKLEFPYRFWHERNSLHMVDNLELLEDDAGFRKNLNLTYAVRDGIISHCGEVDENRIFPRDEAFDLYALESASAYNPFTWEGCVVKVADKISYLGRDLEDAQTLKILSEPQLAVLNDIFRAEGLEMERINNTVLIYDLITDLCHNSTPKEGIALSERATRLMNLIKQFNSEYIYHNDRLGGYKEYAHIAIHRIFNTLACLWAGENTDKNIETLGRTFPFCTSFLHWIEQYWDLPRGSRSEFLKNEPVYPVSTDAHAYRRAIVDYISGMSDQYADKVYRQIIHF